ncbi:penicillin binding protein PBP4B [Lactobacillus sp. ESL0785]|uniref:penicillin binding protein PBP4B n=1 Tax=Lactobacillus sp. ESL0785 TaxID=2983232 RepID=UPI0023F95F35|nr:penicillin binding protein PBP4B [Lactobacillus sp. ESL0785]WEV71249.1 penicillin binding protein PBP4B [Lactobacillus sp. ESL0785]
MIEFIALESEPHGSFQQDITYPQAVPAVNLTTALLNLQMQTFQSYFGQGVLYLRLAATATKDKLLINGQPLELAALPALVWVKVDISSYTINGVNKLQVGLNTVNQKLQLKIPYPVLVDQTKQYQKNNGFKLIDTLIENEIAAGFPSAQLVVIHNGAIVKQKSYGRVNRYSQTGQMLTAAPRVTDGTLYDIASNTKMWATNLALQKLVYEQQLDLKAKIASIFPIFKDQPDDQIKGKNDLTVQDLLEHQAGFPADPQYFDNHDPLAARIYTQDRSQILAKISATPLSYQPGTKTIYSDVDYMLLGLIIEKITGQREDEYVFKNIYEPLGLLHITFNPLAHGFNREQIAATELDGNTFAGCNYFNHVRTNTIQGEVHDSKAYYTMKGVSGHAGLFSNAADLAVLAQMVLNYGGYARQQFFDLNTLAEFAKPKSADPTFGLGWRRQADDGYARIFSNQPGSNTIGHTGWTGTVTLVDFQREIAIILLTNKRNSPIINQQTKDFAGSHYLVGKYGDLISLVYAALDEDSVAANDQKLWDLLRSKYIQIVIQPAAAVQADKQDLAALYQTVIDRAQSNHDICQLLQSSLGIEIKQFLAEDLGEKS